MNSPVVRKYKQQDTQELIELFQETVHQVCKKDYSQSQLDAWAPKEIDESKWSRRLGQSLTLVAEAKGRIAGFASLTSDGYVDMMYVGVGFQGEGVGRELLAELEKEACNRKIKKIYADVSLTARKFFHGQGFRVTREYSKIVGGVAFPNAIMEKELTYED